MDYSQKEALEKLQDFLNRHKKQSRPQLRDAEAVEADLKWDAARFCAFALHKASPPPRSTRQELDAFRAQYEMDHATSISTDALFDRFWLREVLGTVHIASKVSDALRTFREIKEYKQELLFINNLQSKSDNASETSFTHEDLDREIAGYEQRQSIALSREGIFFKRWSQEKEGKVSFSSTESYYGIFLSHWTDFEFLFQWKTATQNPKKVFRITLEHLEDILSQFGHFADRPDLHSLITQRVLREESGEYFLNFWDTQPAYWPALHDRISGLFWEELIADESISSDEERVKIFLQKTIPWEDWPNHLDQVTATAKKHFLDASRNLLANEPDLLGLKPEFTKLRLDSEGHSGLEAFLPIPSHEVKLRQLSGSDLFEMYHSLHRLEGVSNITYLDHQAVRSELTFLIRTLVEHDHKFAQPGLPSTAYFERMIPLLRQGLDKPFLLWSITRSILLRRPEIIAYLLIHPDLCTLGLALLDEQELGLEGVENQSAWNLAVDLLLKSLPDAQEHPAEVARVIFQLFLQLNHKKYSLPYNRNERSEKLTREVHQKKESDILLVLENAPASKTRYVGSQPPYLMPAIFEVVAEHFIKYREIPRYQNGTIGFPWVQWDGICWLLKLDTFWKYEAALAKHRLIVNRLATGFLEQYLALMETKKVLINDYAGDQLKSSIPIWSEKNERLALLDWLYPIYNLDRLNKLGTFLNPRFELMPTDERYHKGNAFNAEKLRTHFGVLLQAIRDLMLHPVPYGYRKHKINSIKKRLELQVIDYIQGYVADAPGEGRVDLFSYSREWRFQSTDKEALLPVLAQAINWFEDKESIINAILSSGDLIKTLILLDYVTAEGIKKTILEHVSTVNLSEFFKKLHWVPEVQTVLVKLSKYPQLIGKFEEAVHYWKTITGSKKSKETKEQLYLSNLLLSYMKGDVSTLEAVPEPDRFYGTSSEMDYHSQKSFYKALLLMESNPQQSYTLFDTLTHLFTGYPVLGMNRMVAKMKIAEAANSTDIYWQAYEEWLTVKSGYYGDQDLSYLEPNLSINILEILHKLKRYRDQDIVFEKLELANRMVPAILKIRIESLVENQRRSDAMSLVESAKAYHQFSDSTEMQWLIDLEGEVRGLDSLEDLKVQYARIFDSTPTKLIKILPDTWNDKKELYPFLVKEIINAADKLLEKIKSIEEIKLEDKYNDLIELVLDARLNAFKWQVGAQNRGAYSAPADGSSGIQPGERDIPIFDANKQMLMNCEALIYRGASNTPEHLQKVFNSHQKKEAFAILLYDTAVEKKGFDGNWNEYVMNHVPNTPYPAGMHITKDLEEITTDFGCNVSAIKVGRSEHGGKTTVYHVFVNINYHLPLPPIPPKKVRAKKVKS